jgi:hypothetical protein
MFLRPDFKPEDAFVHYVFLPPGKNDYIIDGKYFHSIVVDLNHDDIFLPSEEPNKLNPFVKSESVFSDFNEHIDKTTASRCWQYDKVSLEKYGKMKDFIVENFAEFQKMYSMLQAKIPNADQYPCVDKQ